MYLKLIFGILIPFIGTAVGAFCVFFMKRDIGSKLKSILAGFAGGVMVAASVWSLLIPAIDGASEYGRLSFMPALIGLILGVLFFIFLDPFIRRLSDCGKMCKNSSMTVLAVTLHNLPEGMAVGVAFAGWLCGEPGVTFTSAIALAVGISIQNFPEGAIISMPLAGCGFKRSKAFLYGILSGVVEPIGALITVVCSGFIVPFLPYLLSFAAGAMLYVVIEELVPEMHEGKHSNLGVFAFAIGFCVMMALDVALG